MYKFRKQLRDAYLDYFNNYLSIARFAEAYGLTDDEASTLISLGREVHERVISTKESED